MWRPVYSDPFISERKDGRLQGISKYKDERGSWRQKTCLIPKNLTSQRSIKKYLRDWWIGLNRASDNELSHVVGCREEQPSKAVASKQACTVTEMIQYMLEDKLASGIIELSTYSKEQTTLQRVRKHPIGAMDVNEVTELDCMRFFRYLRDERKLAINTIRVSQLQLKSAYWLFLREHRTENNPMQFIKLYPKQKSIPNAVTRVESERFFDAVNELKLGSRYDAAVWLAFYTGMREAEIAALRWSDVDMESGVIIVTHSIGKDDTRRTQGRDTYLKLTKNEKRRVIPFNDKLLEVLQRRWECQRAELGECDPLPTAYVVGFADGRYIRPQSISAWWIRFSRKHGLTGNQGRRVKFHDIRHSFATNMLSGGADVKSVASILGHADTSTTLDIYASPDLQAITNAIQTVGKFDGFGK